MFLVFFANIFYRAYNAFLSEHCPRRENIDAETIT